MLKKYSILFTLIGLITFVSCDKDFSLNGNYKRTPVIFCLLDQSDSVHMVRITRTFLGDDDNNIYAKIADSSYFTQVDAKIIEFNDGVETGREWQLHDTLITNKEEGVFYGPEQKMYTFSAKDLNDEYTYKFSGVFDEGKYDANSETKLIGGFNFSGSWIAAPPNSSPTAKFSGNTDSYLTFSPKSSSPTNVAVKSTKLLIRYQETYLDNSVQIKTITWKKTDDTENVDLPTFSGEEFYTLLQSSISIDENVMKREMLDVTVRVVMVDEITEKYMDASKPSSSISQSKPQFTNINSADGKSALGLFAARHIATRTLPLSDNSIKELCIGSYTGNLGFCSSLPAHVNELWYCTP